MIENCPDCVGKTIAGRSRTSVEDVRALVSAREVDAFPGLSRPTAFRHRATATDLLATYDDLDEEVICSMPGAHRHRSGVVVLTACGLTLCMGLDCGTKHIDGFVAVKKARSRSQVYRAHVVVIEQLLETLPARARMVFARVDRIVRYRRNLREAAPILAEALHTRHQNVFRDRTKALKSHPDYFEGIHAWERGPELSEATARRLAELDAVVRGWPDVPKASAAAKVEQELVAIRERIDERTQWLTSAEAFFLPTNLTATLDQVQKELKVRLARVDEDGAVWVRSIRIDLNGSQSVGSS